MQDVICHNPQCRKTFIIDSYQTKIGRGKFCSKKCQYTANMYPIENITTRFWNKVNKCDHGDDCPYCCWLWQGTMLLSGYGDFGITIRQVHTNINQKNKNIKVKAHRASWQIWNNVTIPMPKDIYIAHYCHNPPCCNPNHLHAATQKENINDSIRDGRIPKGSNRIESKLVENDIPNIFSLFANGNTMKSIAKIYGVCRQTISSALYRRTWKHVPIDISIVRTGKNSL